MLLACDSHATNKKLQLIVNTVQGHAWFLQAEMFAANSECAECKQQILRLEDAQVDHIVPFAEGGNTESSNAQLLHSHCNQQKSNRLRLDRVWRS